MPSKTLLAIDQGQHLGGAERFLAELLTRIDADYNVHLACGANSKYHELYKGSKVTIHQMELPPLKPIGLKSLRSRKASQHALQQLINEVHPGVILSNTVRTHIIVSPLAKQLGIPLLWMAHDRTFPTPLLRWFGQYPQQVICCSHFVKDFYQQAMKKSSAPCEVLYPFAIDQQDIASLQEIEKKAIIGMVGKFIPWKGQNIFIEAARHIHQQFPGWRFVIIGSVYEDNPESHQFRDHCQQLIGQYQLQEVIEIKEVSSAQEEMAQWEMLIHCSREPEPLGRVVLEGMAAGCLVIASSLGGAQEVVENGVTGMICNPQPEQLTEIITQFINEEDRRASIGKAAQRKIQQTYSWKTTLRSFQEIVDGFFFGMS